MNSLIRRRGIRHFRLPQSFLENLVHIAASGFDAVVFLTYSNTDQPWCSFFLFLMHKDFVCLARCLLGAKKR